MSDFVIENGVLEDYTGNGGDIVIPENVVSIGKDAFKNCTSLTSVKIPDGVTAIGDSAFDGCTGLTSLQIPDSVISIGSFAFQNCTHLGSIQFPENLMNFGMLAFNNTLWLENRQKENPLVIVNDVLIDGRTCTGNIVIPNGVKKIENSAFRSNYNLISIQLPNSIAEIGTYAFYWCESLISVQIPNSVTKLGYAVFDSCEKLISVRIPDNVIELSESAFLRCDALQEVSLPEGIKFDTSGLPKRTKVTYRKADGSSVRKVPAQSEAVTITVTEQQLLNGIDISALVSQHYGKQVILKLKKSSDNIQTKVLHHTGTKTFCTFAPLSESEIRKLSKQIN